jgi:hypothetical protein
VFHSPFHQWRIKTFYNTGPSYTVSDPIVKPAVAKTVVPSPVVSTPYIASVPFATSYVDPVVAAPVAAAPVPVVQCKNDQVSQSWTSSSCRWCSWHGSWHFRMLTRLKLDLNFKQSKLTWLNFLASIAYFARNWCLICFNFKKASHHSFLLLACLELVAYWSKKSQF